MSARRGHNPARGWARGLGALVLSAALWASGPAQAQGRAPPERACTLPDMVHDLRSVLKHGSPALRRYMRQLFDQSSLSLPLEELVHAFGVERDPEVLEVLGAAIASRSSRMSDPTLIRPVVERIQSEREPAARAASVRALRGIGSVEAMSEVKGPQYDTLIRDHSPEVRQAVVGNLVHEDANVYFGHMASVSEMAVSTALNSPDPELTARLLSEVSMEQVSPKTVEQLSRQLRSDHVNVRAAAAKALGGVPGRSVAGAREDLLWLYRRDDNPQVRKAALEGLVRLGLGQALPLLESLRGVDPSMAAEIDAWQRALRLNLQEWHLIQREKQRLRP